MLKLSLTLACFVCFSTLLHAETQENARIEKMDSEKIIAIFEHGDYKEKLEAYKLLDKKWEDGTLQKSSTEELDKLFKFCFTGVKNFPWDKYLLLSPEKMRHLPDIESQTVNTAGLMMEVLAIGKMLNNPEGAKFASYLEDRRSLSLAEKRQYDIWNKSLNDLKRRQDSREAQKIRTSGYSNCKKNLMDIIIYEKYSKDQVSTYFLTGISEDSIFLAQLKEDKQATEQLLSKIKNQFPAIKGNSLQAKTVRTAFVNLFYYLAPPLDAINWLETVIQMPDLTEREKEFIQQNRLNNLKLALPATSK